MKFPQILIPTNANPIVTKISMIKLANIYK